MTPRITPALFAFSLGVFVCASVATSSTTIGVSTTKTFKERRLLYGETPSSLTPTQDTHSPCGTNCDDRSPSGEYEYRAVDVAVIIIAALTIGIPCFCCICCITICVTREMLDIVDGVDQSSGNELTVLSVHSPSIQINQPNSSNLCNKETKVIILSPDGKLDLGVQVSDASSCQYSKEARTNET